LKIALLDTETSGLNFQKDFIVSFSIRVFRLPEFTEEVNYYTLIKPNETKDNTIDFSSKAFEVNKIKREDLENAPDIQNVKHTVENYLSDCKFIIAHNANFDKAMCEGKQNFNSNFNKKWICSLHDLPIDYFTGIKNRKLSTYAEILNMDSKNAHNSSFDTYILSEMLKKIDSPVDYIEKHSAKKQFYIAPYVSIDEVFVKKFLQEYGFYYNYELKRHARKLSDMEINEIIFPFDIISDDKVYVKKANTIGKSLIDYNVRYFNKTPQSLCEDLREQILNIKKINEEDLHSILNNENFSSKIIKEYKRNNLDTGFIYDLSLDIN